MAIPSPISSLLVIAALALQASPAVAQKRTGSRLPAADKSKESATDASRQTSIKNVTFLVGLWSWREKFKIKSATDESEKKALLVGTSVGLQYQSLGHRTAWSGEIALVSGRANGKDGNNSDTISYESNRVPWSAIIATPSYYLRPSSRVLIGLGAPLVVRNLKWTSEDESLDFETLPAFSAGLLIQTEIVASKSLLLQQSIGIHAASQSIMYNFGLGYIIP